MKNIMTDNNPAAPSQSRGARVLKAIALVAALCLTVCTIQALLVPKAASSAAPVLGLYQGRADDTEYLFLGSSQMFVSIDAPLLSDEYHLPSYCFGAAGQPVVVTQLYLSEFCKYVKPKRVFIEVGTIFNDPSETSQQRITWSYAPLRASRDKFRSLYAMFDGDYERALIDCYLPLVTYHNRWESLGLEDLGFLCLPLIDRLADMPFMQKVGVIQRVDHNFIRNRGYSGKDGDYLAEMKYDLTESYPLERCELPPENADAIRRMVAFCREQGIEPALIKTPNPSWTRARQQAVAELSSELAVPYVDMHEYLDEIGIDVETDFADEGHVNPSGAEKVTRFMAEVILAPESLRG